MDWTLKLSDLAIVFATLLGPILAVQAQGWIDSKRDRRRRREYVFHTMMRTRASSLSVDHVNALNAIPLEFADDAESSRAVRSAFKTYINHLSKPVTAEGWGPKRLELLVSLLQKMGTSLKYNFEAVELENEIYSPVAHGDVEQENDAIRRGLAALLSGKSSLPLDVRSMAENEELVAALKTSH